MRDVDEKVAGGRGGRLHIPRSRGALGGLAVLLLGIWGALIPFIGPYFSFAYTPDEPWAWSAARGWLQVLPGVVAIIGGLLMLLSRNRIVASTGAWLATAAGAWFVIGPLLAGPLGLGDIGEPVAGSDWKQALVRLTFFYGLGALILFFAATSLGRLSVRSVRDIAFDRREADTVEGRRVADEPAHAAAAGDRRVRRPGFRGTPGLHGGPA
ncbi:hypothetical protein [Nocardia flavorosea]|uniref:hypothetical protein n=1 Tax=Nocardia flavorosea TaxID=53429 RepID=UPI000A41831C|nr:hypothetical protein [Nocardia flavorosea]